MDNWTIEKIKAAMEENGSHWWNEETIRFFNTRIASKVFQGSGGVYFVTSEKAPGDSTRRYSVRLFNLEKLSIFTVGSFYSMDKVDAIRRAKELAKGE